MKDDGFTLIGISFLMIPLFLASMVVVTSFQLITKYTALQKTCRTHVLKAQQTLGKKLMALMDLNPKATRLRTERASLEKAISVALGTAPPLAIPLQRLLEINLFRQGLLRGKQEKILFSAASEARTIMGSLAGEFPKAVQFRFSNVLLKVYKSPSTAIAPNHLPVPFFRDLQAIEVHWKIPMKNVLPQILLRFFPQTTKDLSGNCAATLVQKGDVWNPKLHQARF